MKPKIFLVTQTIENKILPGLDDLINFAGNPIWDKRFDIVWVVAGQKVAPAIQNICDRYCSQTVTHIIGVENDAFLYPNPQLLVSILKKLIVQHQPRYVLFRHVMRNCQVAATLALHHEMAIFTAVNGIEKINQNTIFHRQMFNDKFQVKMTAKTERAILTVLPTDVADHSGHALKPEKLDIEIMSAAQEDNTYHALSLKKRLLTELSLKQAEIIVSFGAGLQSKDNLNLIDGVAEIFKNSAKAGSRIACDLGWISHQYQIGETGQSVAPKLYLACGISGSRQHIAGIRNVNTVIAINKDAKAPIFNIADYGIVEDLITFIPILLNSYQEICIGESKH